MHHCSLEPGDADRLPCSPAAERNAEPILGVLRRLLPARGRVLEIASGTGQHAVQFARALPDLEWQPSDSDTAALSTVQARVDRAGLANLASPVALDVGRVEWPVGVVDAIVCVNLLHIAPWAATQGLLGGAGRLLPPGGPLAVYGPFRRDGEHTADSNARFDADLRARDPRWGIRDIADVVTEAAAHGLQHEETLALPANNHVLVFRHMREPMQAE